MFKTFSRRGIAFSWHVCPIYGGEFDFHLINEAFSFKLKEMNPYYLQIETCIGKVVF